MMWLVRITKIFHLLVLAFGLTSLAIPLVQRAKMIDATYASKDLGVATPSPTMALEKISGIDEIEILLTLSPEIITVIDWVDVTRSSSPPSTLTIDKTEAISTVELVIDSYQKTLSRNYGGNTVTASPPVPSTPSVSPIDQLPAIHSAVPLGEVPIAQSADASNSNQVITTDHSHMGGSLQSFLPGDATFRIMALYSHNVHRLNHSNTGILEYNITLEQYSQNKVETCIWDESVPGGARNIGMNMAEGTYIGAANVTGTIEDMWYNSEIDLYPSYDEAEPDMSKFQDWGHFTQVVWRATQSVGCWAAACNRSDGAPGQIGSGFFTVCTYFPAGNVGGQYMDQVGVPLQHPSIQGS